MWGSMSSDILFLIYIIILEYKFNLWFAFDNNTLEILLNKILYLKKCMIRQHVFKKLFLFIYLYMFERFFYIILRFRL